MIEPTCLCGRPIKVKALSKEGRAKLQTAIMRLKQASDKNGQAKSLETNYFTDLIESIIKADLLRSDK